MHQVASRESKSEPDQQGEPDAQLGWLEGVEFLASCATDEVTFSANTVSPAGCEEARLPTWALRLIAHALGASSTRVAGDGSARGLALLPRQVAWLLDAPTAYVDRMIDAAELRSVVERGRRIVYFSDLLAYIARYRRNADEALSEMTAISQELGLYEQERDRAE